MFSSKLVQIPDSKFILKSPAIDIIRYICYLQLG